MAQLIEAQVAEFKRRGWIVLREVLSKLEAEHYSKAVAEYIESVRASGARSVDGVGFDAREGKGGVDDGAAYQAYARGETNPGQSGPSQTAYRLQDAPLEVVSLVRSARLGRIAAEFLDVNAVRLLHFCGLFKAGGAPATLLHQDLNYIPLNTSDVISAWIALDDVTAEMSPLIYADGSHLFGSIDGVEAARRFRMVQACPMKAGDVALHSGWIVHGALKSTSSQTRKAFGIGYYADGARIDIRQRGGFVQGLLNSCFEGLAPGDLAESEANPVVFRRSS